MKLEIIEDSNYILALGTTLSILPSGSLVLHHPKHIVPLEFEGRYLSLISSFARPRPLDATILGVATDCGLELEPVQELISDLIKLELLLPVGPRPLSRFVLFRESNEKWKKDQTMPFPVQSSSYLEKPKIYYPGLCSKEVYDKDNFEWMPSLESSYTLIKSELNGLLRKGVGFHEVFDNVTNEGKWAAAYLWIYGKRIDENCDLCPATSAVLESIKGATEYGTALFSVLAPGTMLTPHFGITNAKLRCHLPIYAPEECGLQVGEQTIFPTGGTSYVFCDAFLHFAWNLSNKPRFILMFDFYHPDLTEEEVKYLRSETFSEQISNGYLQLMNTKEVPTWVYKPASYFSDNHFISEEGHLI